MTAGYMLGCAVWELTLACNLNCIHCGSSAGRKRGDELTSQEAEKLCHDLKRAGCLGVALMGGEPMLRKDFFEIAEIIRTLGMELSVITNGTIYSSEAFKKLKALNPRVVAVSLDASTSEIHDHIRGHKGAFKKTWDFINIAVKEGFPVSVITTIHKLNLSELPAMREQLLGKKIAWQIQVAGAEGRRFPKEMLLDEEEFYSVGLFIASTKKKYSVKEMPVIGAHDLGFNSMIIGNLSLYNEWSGCQAGISVLGIQSNGNVKGCLSMDDSTIEGNVKDINIYDLWHSDRAFSYSRRFKSSDAGDNCMDCKRLESCKGGCNEMSLMKTGKFHNDPYCFHKIEQRIFRKELRNPFYRLMLKTRNRINNISSKYNSEKLFRIFLGHR